MRSVPVMKETRSESRNSAAWAMSPGVPSRPGGICRATGSPAFGSSGQRCCIGPGVGPGRTRRPRRPVPAAGRRPRHPPEGPRVCRLKRNEKASTTNTASTRARRSCAPRSVSGRADPRRRSMRRTLITQMSRLTGRNSNAASAAQQKMKKDVWLTGAFPGQAPVATTGSRSPRSAMGWRAASRLHAGRRRPPLFGRWRIAAAILHSGSSSSILYPSGSSMNAITRVPCFMGPGARVMRTPSAPSFSQVAWTSATSRARCPQPLPRS